jgi:hypothetical protein
MSADGDWVAKEIYCTTTLQNYKHGIVHTSQLTRAHTSVLLISSLCQSSGNGIQRRTFPFSGFPKCFRASATATAHIIAPIAAPHWQTATSIAAPHCQTATSTAAPTGASHCQTATPTAAPHWQTATPTAAPHCQTATPTNSAAAPHWQTATPTNSAAAPH